MRIRRATRDDACFIALAVTEALGGDVMRRGTDGIGRQERHRLDMLADAVREDDTLYSWRHTVIAQDGNGMLLGALVAYPGDGYMDMRSRTFSMLNELITFDVSSMDAEAKAGEYYIDSLAIVPEYRGKGVGTQLLRAAMDEARSSSRIAVLACAPDNIGAKSMYESLGFRHEGNLFIFGHEYLRMTAE
ncbi:MAG: GNAT family N-acetyltransferase [Bacteroidaceae bacterium]|nr:GNAT family N-acetyltransferase [Bacteroidaceae bacterium]